MSQFVFALTVLYFVMAQAAPFEDIPGAIPLTKERQAAADLVYKGQILLPDEARELVRRGEIKDLSLLNPVESSILWKNQFLQGQPDDLGTLNLHNSEIQVEYISMSKEANGRLTFLAQRKTDSGNIKIYQFNLDVKGHNILLRKTLLRKIGYNIPAIERVPRLQVKFKGAFSKKEFIKDIQSKTFLPSERWVIAGADSDDEYLTLQDVIAFEGPDDRFYNLARGDLADPGIIQGRRLLNALLVPYFLTDAPESINLFSWVGSQIFNGQLVLPYNDLEAFSTISLDDARWIMRRILNLNRADWAEVARLSRVPVEAQAVLVEKLISRRNYLRKYLNLENESQELSVNYKISAGERLQEGKLVGESWAGFARHFAGVDPDSPWSSTEIKGFLKSRALGNAISNAVFEFNNRLMPKTDLGFKIFDRQLDVSARDFAEFLITGEIQRKPRNFWSTKFFNTNIITSRDIIAGSYLGTENIVQLADTIGFATDGGLFYLGENLPMKTFASGRAKLFFVKTYTHIKPLKSIQMGLKEPFRNIMVPLLKRDAVHPLKKIRELEKSKNVLASEELEKQIKEQLNQFTQLFGAGESLLVSVSMGPDLEFTVGKGLNHDAQVYARIQDKLTAISRTHIFRKDEKSVHVYIDPALANVFSLAFGLTAKIPILEFGWDWQKGAAQTNYFQFNLDSDLSKNPQFFDHILAVTAALEGGSLDLLKSLQSPYTIEHSFSGRNGRFQLLAYKYLQANTRHQLKITHPQTDNRDAQRTSEYVRRTRGQRSGTDYESLLLNITNALIKEKFKDNNVKFDSKSSDNPGDTVSGRAVSRQVVVEAELNRPGARFENLFAGINYRWKGWLASKADINEILDEIQQSFGRDMFRRPDLNETREIQFYSIDLEIDLYEKAFRHILQLKESEVRQIFSQHGRQMSTNESDMGASGGDGWANAVVSDLMKLKSAQARGDRRLVVEVLTDIFEVVESQLSFQGFKIFVGGEANIFSRGTMRGFRVGAENGQQDIQTISMGQIGATKPRGPLAFVQSNMNITGGEFFINWLLNPL